MQDSPGTVGPNMLCAAWRGRGRALVMFLLLLLLLPTSSTTTTTSSSSSSSSSSSAAAAAAAAGDPVLGAHPGPPPVAWARGYAFNRSESHPHAGIQLADGGYVVVGDGQDYSRSDAPYKRRLMVLRTDGDGQLQWQRSVGDSGYNYGKNVIELAAPAKARCGARASVVLVVGALTDSSSGEGTGALCRALLLYSSHDGEELQRLLLPNSGATEGLRDGLMAAAVAAPESGGPPRTSSSSPSSILAVGFVGGENTTAPGYVDEPMFLIGGGQCRPSLVRLALHWAGADGCHPKLVKVSESTIDPPAVAAAEQHRVGRVGDQGTITAAAADAAAAAATAAATFRAVQAMRVVYVESQRAFAVSHTMDQGDANREFQFGLSMVSIDTFFPGLKIHWTRACVVMPPTRCHTHAATLLSTEQRAAELASMHTPSMWSCGC
jgi:hypothetical protein